MTTMTSRQRLLTALNHQEPDRVPYDLSGSHVTGINHVAYQNLRSYLGLKPEKEIHWADVIQQLAIPSEDLLEKLQVDTRGLYPLTSSNWDVMNSAINRLTAGEIHIINSG